MVWQGIEGGSVSKSHLELHRALNENLQVHPSAWTVGSNGSGPRHWFVLRKPHGPMAQYEYHNDKNENLIWYTALGALKKAEQLNKQDGLTS